MTGLRRFATPLAIGAFSLSATTGLLMFFRLEQPFQKELHEWLGWALVTGVSLHVWVNRAAFVKHLRQRTGQAVVGLFALVTLGSFAPLAGEEGGREGLRAVMDRVTHAPVEQLAPLAGRTPDALVAALREAGFADASATTSVSALAGGDREREQAALRVLFAP